MAYETAAVSIRRRFYRACFNPVLKGQDFLVSVDFVSPTRWLGLKCVRIKFAQLRVVRLIVDGGIGLQVESRV